VKILFVHQNFPGQFLHLAPELARLGHQCLALTDDANRRDAPIPVLRYHFKAPQVDRAQTRVGRTYTQMTDRGIAVARAARFLRDRRGYRPDMILGHPGWGETLFLKQIWPEARLVVHAEFYYRAQGQDVGFDPEFARDPFEAGILAQGRAAHLGQALLHADAGFAPTHWQASTFPDALRSRIEVLHEGVDCDRLRPDAAARFALPTGHVLKPGDEVLTFVNRNLEPYRGVHVFLRALPEVLRARPAAQVVIVGGDGASYGSMPSDGRSWRETLLAELQGRLDLSRVHFLGRVPYDRFVALMQVSRAHAYLTYPFVLSWSMLEAMAAGALVIGSRTAPVEEVVTDGMNGRLVDFFDIPAWSRTLIDVLAQPDRFQPLREAGRQTVLARYSLPGCLARLVQFVEAQGPGGGVA